MITSLAFQTWNWSSLCLCASVVFSVQQDSAAPGKSRQEIIDQAKTDLGKAAIKRHWFVPGEEEPVEEK